MNQDKIVISLGWNCHPTSWALKNGLRHSKSQGYNTCPFDMCVTNYEGILLCIQEDFKYLTDPNYLVLKKINETKLSYNKDDIIIYHSRYKFIFNHESPGHGNLYNIQNWSGGINHFINNNFEKFIEKYNNRVNNFKNYLSNYKNITFVISTLKHNIDELKNILGIKYLNTNFDFIILKSPESKEIIDLNYYLMEIDEDNKYY